MTQNQPFREVRTLGVKTNPRSLLSSAERLVNAGFAVLAVKANKTPSIREGWKPFQNIKPNLSQVRRWFSYSESVGVAIITGKVSGNVEVVDIDTKNDDTKQIWKEYKKLIIDHDKKIFEKLVVIKTVSGGIHLIFRHQSAATLKGNQVFAKNKNNHPLIETRCEGGYAATAPTSGYEVIQGDLSKLPILLDDEILLLHALAISLNRQKVEVDYNERKESGAFTGLSPFDDYNKRGDVLGLLESEGWQRRGKQGGLLQLCRPGKDGGQSATYFEDSHCVNFFTTSTQFEAKGYSPSGIYTVLEHNGDYSAANKALYEQNFGDRHEAKTQKSGTRQKTKSDYELNEKNELSLKDIQINYPKISETAFSGLAGEVVKIIEPHTEADRVALLVQLLAGFGSLIGKTAYFKAGADYHYSKLFSVLVGATASGRKGSSWSEIRRLLIRVDESFLECVHSGLSSGEGLVYLVRDAMTKNSPIREKGRIVDYQEEITDTGIADKRAFVIEPEFSRLLKVSQREGNTLSSIIRDSWDTDRLAIKTKNPVKATGAHISIVGHITKDELRRTLAEADTTNGFANRFLWLCVKRSKYLPEGGNLRDSDLNNAIAKLQKSYTFAKTMDEMKRDDAANQKWREIYKPLSDGHAGLVGSVTSRATAQVLRLAMIYALLDCSRTIQLKHLQAGLALWDYCEASAKYIFGASLGNKIADEIFTFLQGRKGGASRTEISESFGKNKPATELRNALELLIECGKVGSRSEETDGRTKEIFSVIDYELNEFEEISTFNSFNSSNSYQGTEKDYEDI